ncbi:MAG: hypothetical protein RR393_00080 [Bacteroidales bacterium]
MKKNYIFSICLLGCLFGKVYANESHLEESMQNINTINKYPPNSSYETTLDTLSTNSTDSISSTPFTNNTKDTLTTKTKKTGEKAINFINNLWKEFGFAIDARVDFQYQGTAKGDNDINFHVQSMKLRFDGHIIPQVRYFVKLRLTSSSPNHRDNSGEALNQAWIAIDLKKFTIKVGKQDLSFAAWEYDQNYADMYISSVVNDQIDGSGTGVTVNYSPFNQSFGFQILNSSPVNFSNTKNSFAWTLNYTGSFDGGHWQPAISYTFINNAIEKGLFFLTTGLKYKNEKWTATLDYYYGNYIQTTRLQSGKIDTNITHYVSDQSLALNIEYKFLPQWNVILKGTFDNRYDKIFKHVTFNRYSISAAIEYYPFKKLPLQAHIAGYYRYYDYKYKPISDLIQDKSINEFSIFVGLRWLFQIK